MKLTRRLVDRLLKPLGMHVDSIVHSGNICLRDSKNYLVHCKEKKRGKTLAVAEDLENLFDKIACTETWHIVDPLAKYTYLRQTTIVNPYFGCRSIDEMIVKSDLIV